MADNSGNDISELIENNTAEYFLYLGHINGCEVLDRQDIKYVFAGSGYNRIMRARFSTSETDKIAEQIVGKLDALGIGAIWYVSPLSEKKLHSTLTRHGFTHNRDWLSMALDLTSFSAVVVLPSGFEIRTAESDEDLEIWAKVVLTSFGIDDNVHGAYGRHLIAQDTLNRDRHIHYLGLLDGRPVATAVLFKGTEAAGIYWVGTLPEFRGRGIATAMMNHMLSDAKESGYKVASLNSSPIGHPLYQKIGFIDYFTTNIYQRDSRPIYTPKSTSSVSQTSSNR